jgi:hypothetical protein
VGVVTRQSSLSTDPHQTPWNLHTTGTGTAAGTGSATYPHAPHPVSQTRARRSIASPMCVAEVPRAVVGVVQVDELTGSQEPTTPRTRLPIRPRHRRRPNRLMATAVPQRPPGSALRTALRRATHSLRKRPPAYLTGQRHTPMVTHFKITYVWTLPGSARLSPALGVERFKSTCDTRPPYSV